MNNIDIKIYIIKDKKGIFNKLIIGDKIIFFQKINGKIDEESLSKEDLKLVKICLKYKQVQYQKVFELIRDEYGVNLDIGSIQAIEDALKPLPEL